MKTLNFLLALSIVSIIALFNPSVNAQNFVQQTSNTTSILWGIHFPTANVGYAVGLNGTIMKTTNGGTTWASQTSITTQFIQDVYFFNADTGVICGYGGFYSKTYDGGVNWTDRIDPGTTNKLLRFFFLSDLYGFMVGEGGVIRSTIDGGDTWTSMTSPTTNKINDISFIDPQNGVIVGDMNDVYKTVNGGTNWTLLTPSFPETNSNFGVSMINSNTIFLCGGVQRIMKTTNGGSNWTNLYNSTANYWRGILFMDTNTGFVVGQGGKIILSVNGGTSFTTVASGVTTDLNSISLAPDNSIYIVGSGGVILKKAGQSNPTPVADFSTSINLLAVTFTDASSNNPTSWSWTFGNGQTSTLQNPSHTYTASGTYNVCLTATNTGGSNTKCIDVIVSNVITPVADFDFTINNSVVTYKDKSINNPTSWLWNFGDGQTSTLQNPPHSYTSSGNYNVCLTATNTAGSNQICKVVNITIVVLPVANFTFSQNQLTVSFSDQTTNNPSSWLWNFGDGLTSTLQNPSHIYSDTGSYIVCLTTTNLAGADSACKNVLLRTTDLGNFSYSFNTKIEVYPNPGKSTFHIKTMEIKNASKSNYNLQIISSIGQIVFEKSIIYADFNLHNEEIEIKDIFPGIYILELRNSENLYRQKFVIQY